MSHNDILEIRGEKGGGSSKPYVPKETPNSLRSAAKGRILDLLAHGPIVGLVDGNKSIFLDGVPLENPDGSTNFSGVSVSLRNGYPDQATIPGFRAVENPSSVSAQVKADTPIIRSVSNSEADAVVVTLQLSALMRQTDQGDLLSHSVSIAIDSRVNGSAWSTVVNDTISGKTASPYQRSYRVELNGEGEFEVRVRRTSPDDPDSKSRSETFWSSMTEVVDARLSYPDAALVGLELDSALFGNQMPARAYDVKLSIIKVPSNYNPETRTYTGLWNGSFKNAWTDNPAWVYYDLATHPVIGVGLTGVDKWALYQIAQYCDELVPNGLGGFEPRFTINTIFSDREDAITALSTLASVFRGMNYWGTDTVVPVADMPSDPRKLVTPANVVNGEFQYSGTSLKERHSVAIVMWNDPEEDYKAIPEFVEDPDSIELFGWREVQVTALGCTSRGQANRLGKWILYSERRETQTISYEAATDHADLHPGDIIEVSDPDRAGARLGGRVVTPGLSQVELDSVPAAVSGSTWYLSVVTENGVIERRQVTSFAGNTAKLASPLLSIPVPGAVWVLSSASVLPAQFRVVSIEEQESGNTYRINATEYDPNKYDVVELGLDLPRRDVSLLPSGPLAAPLDLHVEVYTYLAGGTEHQGAAVSWTPSNDPRTLNYIAEVRGPTDVEWRPGYSGPNMSFDLKDITGGEWMFRVRSVNSLGTGSAWVTRTVQISHLLLPTPPDYIDVDVSTFTATLIPRGAYPGAMYEFWRAAVPLTDQTIESNAVRLTVSTDLVDTNLKSATTYYYYVRGANAYGVSSWVPAQATTLADFDDIITALDEDIRRPGGLFEEMVGLADGVESVLTTTLETAVTELTTQVGEARTEFQAGQVDLAGDIETVKTETTAAVAEVKAGLGSATASLTSAQAEVADLKRSALLEDIRHLAGISMMEGATARATVEEVTRQTETETLAYRIESVQAATSAEIAAAVSNEQIARTTADGALAAEITSLGTKFTGDIAAAITSEQMARSDADGALATQITALESRVTDRSSALFELEKVTRAYSDSSLAAQSFKMSARLGDDIVAAVSVEQVARATETEALASQITALSAQFTSDISAAISLEQVTRSDADSALASQITALESTTGSLSSAITAEQTARTTGFEALALSIENMEAGLGEDYTVGLATEKQARIDGDGALTQQINTLTSYAQGVSAALTTEQTARANADTALSGQITALTAQVNDDVVAAIAVEQLARTDADTALAGQITTLTTQMGTDIAAAVGTEASARATADDALTSLVTSLESKFGVAGDNLVLNSSFEADTNNDGMADGWSVYNFAAVAFTADRVAGRIGGFAQRVRFNATSTNTHGVYLGSTGLSKRWVTDQWYTVSFFAKKSAGAGFTGCSLGWNKGPQTTTAMKNPNLSSAWQRYAFKIKWDAGAATPNLDGPSLWITRSGTSVAGDEFIIDDVQVQEGEALTGYSESAAANEAAIRTEAAARASADSALSSQITTLSASTTTQFASVSQQFTAQTTYTNGAVARAVTTATVNGKKAVFGISVDGVVSEIGAVADRFYVYNPTGGTYTLAFAVVGGQTVIRDALIRDASITTAKIANATITTAKIADAAITNAKIGGTLQSTAVDAYGRPAWSLAKDGTFQINGTGAGGRIEQRRNFIKVFDANGRKRVHIGDLSA